MITLQVFQPFAFRIMTNDLEAYLSESHPFIELDTIEVSVLVERGAIDVLLDALHGCELGDVIRIEYSNKTVVTYINMPDQWRPIPDNFAFFPVDVDVPLTWAFVKVLTIKLLRVLGA